jgi:hypothetical protein
VIDRFVIDLELMRQLQFDELLPVEQWEEGLRHSCREEGIEISDEVCETLLEFESVLMAISVDGDWAIDLGYSIEGFLTSQSWTAFDVIYRGCDCHDYRVFSDPDLPQKGMYFARFGTSGSCFFQVGPDRMEIVTSLPLVQGFRSLADYAIFARACTAPSWPSSADYLYPTQIRTPGVLLQMCYGWDNPNHYFLQNQAPEVPFEQHVARLREVAREWLDKTQYPPVFIDGWEPHWP